MRNFFMLALFGVILATIAIVVRSGMLARKNPGKPINATMRASMETPQFTTADAQIIAERFGNARKTPSGLEYVVHAPGTGELPIRGQVVSVHYTGTFLNGEKFDSSLDHDGPFNFQVGFGRVIPAWDEAFAGMRKGEKRTLIVPYWLAYGEKGRGKIPGKATLLFEVELVDIR